MNRSALYVVICRLFVACGAMGYQLYQARQNTDHVEVDLGKNGLSIQKR
jgi:hypothetical protein